MSDLSLPGPKKKLSEEFAEFANSLRGEKVVLGKIMEIVEMRGHSLLIIILSVPFMQPIPVPGLSLYFGLITAIVGVRITVGLPPYVPQTWLKKEIPAERAKHFFSASSKLLAKIEKFLKPRMHWLFQTKWIRPLDGTLLILMGILLALPLPPGTNFPPALPILCMGLGMLEKDGAFILLSYFFSVLNLMLFGAIAIFGYEEFVKLFNF